MDITGILKNIEDIETPADLENYKKLVLDQFETMALQYGKQATQLAGLTNPTTFIASFISMLVPIAEAVGTQVAELTTNIQDLNAAFQQRIQSVK